MSAGGWTGLVLGVITFLAGMVGHICYSVWWASRINTTLEFVQKTLMEIATDLKAQKLNGVTKEEFAREVTRLEGQNKGAFNRVDELRNRVDVHETVLGEHKLEFEFIKRGGGKNRENQQ